MNPELYELLVGVADTARDWSTSTRIGSRVSPQESRLRLAVAALNVHLAGRP